MYLLLLLMVFAGREIFNGADSIILNNPLYVKDTALLKQLFWDTSVDERRKNADAIYLENVSKARCCLW